MSVNTAALATNTVSDEELTDAQQVLVPEFAAPAADLERDQYGRPVIEGVHYTRTSTEAGMLSDGNALRKWQLVNLLLGLARNPDLVAIAAGLDPYGTAGGEVEEETMRADKRKANELIETALDRAGTKAKANWGTAVHRFTEPGAPQFVPPARVLPGGKRDDDMRADVEAYWRETMERRGIVRVESEVFVVSRRFGVAGTTDGVFEVPGWGRVVGDVKTGGLHPSEHSVQLAGYADGERYNHRAPDGQRWQGRLDVRQDVALLLHVPKGEAKCELYLINLQDGRHGMELAKAIRAHRSNPSVAQPLDDVVPFPDYTDAPQRVMLGIDQQLADHHVGADLDPCEQADPGYLQDEQATYDEGGVLPVAGTVVTNPGPDPEPIQPPPVHVAPTANADAGLDQRLQAEAAARRERNARAREQAQDDQDAPMAAKVRSARDLRESMTAPARQVGEHHPGVQTIELPEPVAPTTAVDVNGNTVDLQGDGFDDLRVSDPPPQADPDSIAAGLVAHSLGGRVLSLAERIATAVTRDEVNALWFEFNPRGEWTADHHQLAQQRVAVLTGR